MKWSLWRCGAGTCAARWSIAIGTCTRTTHCSRRAFSLPAAAALGNHFDVGYIEAFLGSACGIVGRRGCHAGAATVLEVALNRNLMADVGGDILPGQIHGLAFLILEHILSTLGLHTPFEL